MRDPRNMKTWFGFTSEPIPSSSSKPYPAPPTTKQNKTPRTLLGELVTIICVYKSPLHKTDYIFFKKGNTIIEQK